MIHPDAFILSHAAHDLIGRQEALERLSSEALQAGCVSVIGPPGVGKSALLRAWSALAHAPTQWLDLTPVRAPDELERYLETQLQIAQAPPTSTGLSSQHRLADAMCARSEVLVLDNAEHVIEALRPLLTLWLAHAPTLHVVIGSRVAMSVNEERVISLAPLSQTPSHPQALSDAEQLLWRRTGQHGPPTQAQRAPLRQLAAQLDGLPLALELAATRLRWLSTSDLLARLDRHDVVHAYQGDERHGSLDRAIMTSWELLEGPAQRLLAGLSLCRSGFTMGAAETLCDAPDEAMGLLESLLTHSLVQISEAHGLRRYTMLWSIARFAARQRDAMGLTPLMRQRHAAHYAQLGREAYAQARGHGMRLRGHALLIEQDNLHDALLNSRDGDASASQQLDLLLGLSLIMWRQGDYQSHEALGAQLLALSAREGCTLEERARCIIAAHDTQSHHMFPHDEIHELTPKIEQAEAWPMPAQIELQMRYFSARAATSALDAQARAQLLDWLARARAHDMIHCEIALVIALAHNALSFGHPDQAQAFSVEALRGAERMGDAYMALRAHQFLGAALYMAGDLEGAIAMQHEALKLSEDLNYPAGQAQVLHYLGSTYLDEGQLDLATERLEQAVAVGERYGISWSLPLALIHLGAIALDRDDYEHARVLLLRAHHLSTLDQHRIHQAVSELYLTQTYDLDGQPQLARETALRALEALPQLTRRLPQVYVRCLMAREHVREGALEAAIALLDEAEAILPETPRSDEAELIALHRCFVTLARYEQAIAQGKTRVAQDMLRALLETLGAMSRVEAPHTRSPLERLVDVRLALKRLKRQLPQELARRLEVQLRDPAGEALLLDRATSSFRPPGALAWVDMAQRLIPFRMLNALAMQRHDHPGEPIAADALIEQTWPDERVAHEAAQNRLYVTLSTLRRAGLKQAILSERGGYLISPQIEVLLC